MLFDTSRNASTCNLSRSPIVMVVLQVVGATMQLVQIGCRDFKSPFPHSPRGLLVLVRQASRPPVTRACLNTCEYLIGLKDECSHLIGGEGVAMSKGSIQCT